MQENLHFFAARIAHPPDTILPFDLLYCLGCTKISGQKRRVTV